jgi:hypothetical protein
MVLALRQSKGWRGVSEEVDISMTLEAERLSQSKD